MNKQLGETFEGQSLAMKTCPVLKMGAWPIHTDNFVLGYVIVQEQQANDETFKEF